MVVTPFLSVVFPQNIFKLAKRKNFAKKSTFFSPLRWRLSIFVQINIGWIPCLEFSFFCAILGGELSVVAFCYGTRFIGLLVWFWFWFGGEGEGVGELLGYFGVGDSDDVCCGGGEAEEVDVAVPHN